MVVRFVTRPKKGKRSSKNKNIVSGMEPVAIPIMSPMDSDAALTPTSGNVSDYISGSPSSTPSAAALAARLASTPEPDGATLNCIAVSIGCFKMGRITVPPAIALACEGFSRSPITSDGGKKYSKTNPPSSWTEHAQPLRTQKNAKEFQYVHILLVARPASLTHTCRKFIRGGWRDIPAGERWWDDAMGGEVEEQRHERMEVFKVFRESMEAVRGMTATL
jgi:hypothetical protein